MKNIPSPVYKMPIVIILSNLSTKQNAWKKREMHSMMPRAINRNFTVIFSKPMLDSTGSMYCEIPVYLRQS